MDRLIAEDLAARNVSFLLVPLIFALGNSHSQLAGMSQVESIGHSIFYPHPPIEVLYISPPQKSKLLSPQEKKIKVPTHYPFRIYSKIKNANIQETPPPPSDFP